MVSLFWKLQWPSDIMKATLQEGGIQVSCTEGPLGSASEVHRGLSSKNLTSRTGGVPWTFLTNNSKGGFLSGIGFWVRSFCLLEGALPAQTRKSHLNYICIFINILMYIIVCFLGTSLKINILVTFSHIHTVLLLSPTFSVLIFLLYN